MFYKSFATFTIVTCLLKYPWYPSWKLNYQQVSIDPARVTIYTDNFWVTSSPTQDPINSNNGLPWDVSSVPIDKTLLDKLPSVTTSRSHACEKLSHLKWLCFLRTWKRGSVPAGLLWLLYALKNMSAPSTVSGLDIVQLIDKSVTGHEVLHSHFPFYWA